MVSVQQEQPIFGKVGAKFCTVLHRPLPTPTLHCPARILTPGVTTGDSAGAIKVLLSSFVNGDPKF